MGFIDVSWQDTRGEEELDLRYNLFANGGPVGVKKSGWEAIWSKGLIGVNCHEGCKDLLRRGKFCEMVICLVCYLRRDSRINDVFSVTSNGFEKTFIVLDHTIGNVVIFEKHKTCSILHNDHGVDSLSSFCNSVEEAGVFITETQPKVSAALFPESFFIKVCVCKVFINLGD